MKGTSKELGQHEMKIPINQHKQTLSSWVTSSQPTRYFSWEENRRQWSWWDPWRSQRILKQWGGQQWRWRKWSSFLVVMWKLWVAQKDCFLLVVVCGGEEREHNLLSTSTWYLYAFHPLNRAQSSWMNSDSTPRKSASFVKNIQYYTLRMYVLDSCSKSKTASVVIVLTRDPWKTCVWIMTAPYTATNYPLMTWLEHNIDFIACGHQININTIGQTWCNGISVIPVIYWIRFRFLTDKFPMGQDYKICEPDNITNVPWIGLNFWANEVHFPWYRNG